MRRLINLIAIASLGLPLGVPLPAAAQNHPLTPRVTTTAPNAAQPAPFAPGVVLVGLAPDYGAALNLSGASAASTSLQGVLAALSVKQIEPVFGAGVTQPAAGLLPAAPDALSRIYRLHLPAGADVLWAVASLQANPAVAYAEPDYLAQLITTPSDPLYPDQWGLAAVNASAAWDTVTGTTGVTIAVIDSGLDLTHPDLASQLWTNPGETPSNSLDDDNNGYIDDLHGANIYGHNVDLTDTTGHGTQVAGIIAAATNNAIGVAGLCWQCRLMVVKVTQPGGIANYSDIAAGIAYAAQKGAEVINLSLGGLTDSSTLRAAIAAAAPTAVIIAGAGNNDSAALFYPAAYDAVVAVAGTTISDTKVATSNYGAWVDLTAPGEMITTTTAGGGYGLASGTSLAAPFVAGAAGLLRSQHPDWSPALVQAQMLQTAEAIDGANPSHAGLLGHGRLDAAAAVTTVPAPLLRYAGQAVNGQANAPLGAGATFSLTVDLLNQWGPAAVVTGTLAVGDGVTVTKSSASWGAVEAGATVANGADPFLVSVPGSAFGLTLPFTLSVVADGLASTVYFTATTSKPMVAITSAIAVDTVWTKDQVYLANTNVIVNTGITLTIEPGTEIRFASGRALIVNGTLIADGTPSEPIRFTSNAANPAPGDWGLSGNPMDTGGIFFLPSSVPAAYAVDGQYLSGSLIRNAIIEYSTGLMINGAPFIDHNLIWKNGGPWYAVFVARVFTDDELRPVVSHNRVIENAQSAFANDLRPVLLQQNLFANNLGALTLSGQQNGTPVVISNTISSNGPSTNQHNCAIIGVLCMGNWNPFGVMYVSGNNVAGNPAFSYDLAMGQATKPITVTQNYWGSADQATIQARIADQPLLPVTFVPFLTAPNPDAPAFLHQLTLSPASPVGIQTATFVLTFSAPMDQSVDPTVTFGVNAPYADWAVADNAQWTSATTWQATFDITSLIARATHTLSVSGARGLDGLTIPTDTRFSFVVDYAGEITDQTPPIVSEVTVTGRSGDAAFVEAFWTGADDGTTVAALHQTLNSTVTGYRYAIGSAPGATDVVNWTSTNNAFITRTIPGLIEGHTYWFSVQARNTGGLWSQTSLASFVAGLQTHWRTFLPLVLRN